MRQKISPIEESVLRAHIRLVLREGDIPRSNPVNIGRASQGYVPIGMPGATVIKAVGVLIALGWASKYVNPKCISSISELGMPLPFATIELVKIRGAAAVGAAAAAAGGAGPDLARLATSYVQALKKDIDGDTSDLDDLFHYYGGLNGIFDYVKTYADGRSSNCVWPSRKTDFTNLEGSGTWTGPVKRATTEYGKVCEFVDRLMNAQCSDAIEPNDVQRMIREQLNTRQKFLDFVKTYIKTCYEDFDKTIDEHKQVLSDKKITLNPATTRILNSVQPKYLAASAAIN